MGRQKKQVITPDQLCDTIIDCLNLYSDDVVTALPDLVKDTGKYTVQVLKKKAKAAGIGGTKYVNSFSSKVTKETATLTTVTVHSKKYYRLAHLLEKGHWITNQTGQIYGMTEAKPHWKPAEDEATEELGRKIQMKLEGEL